MKVIAIDGHPRSEELADYVGDLLEPDACERIEAHVSSCPRCAVRLEQAAGFQMLLHDVAVALPLPASPPFVVAPSRLGRMRRHVSAASGLWAAAAAFTLMLWSSGEVEPHQHVASRVAAAAAPAHDQAQPRRAGCSSDDPGCTDGLLASVDPLESIDPLSSWPDDPLVRSGFDQSDDDLGEPCGSGEDGGPLVCPTTGDPFSG